MTDRRRLRSYFLAAMRSEGLDYAEGGAVIKHPDLAWTLSLVVDGVGAEAPYRLLLGASFTDLSGENEPPRRADDCYLYLPLGFAEASSSEGLPVMPSAAFPAWQGDEAEAADAINACVRQAAAYMSRVKSVAVLRERWRAGDFDAAFVIAPVRQLLDQVV